MEQQVRLHPWVLFAYFALVTGCSMALMHPVCLIGSFLCALLLSIALKGRRAMQFGIKILLPLMVLTALLNPLFSHQGVTILWYFPSGNPLTLESVLWGLAAALLFGAVLCWLSCLSALMTADQIMCLLGAAPALALLFSMVLRFIPRFRQQLQNVRQAQLASGRSGAQKTLRSRVGGAAAALSILITWSLEHGVETADTMRSRGYGLKGRSRMSVFPFTRRDGGLLALLLLSAGAMLWGGASGLFAAGYVPVFFLPPVSFLGALLLGWYLLLCAAPLLIHIWKELQWKRIMSKN